MAELIFTDFELKSADNLDEPLIGGIVTVMYYPIYKQKVLLAAPLQGMQQSSAT